MEDKKLKILEDAYAAKTDEVLHYQINIDNFRMALEKLEARQDPDLAEFKTHLQGLLRSTIVEQKKSKIMLDVLEGQLITPSLMMAQQ